MRPSGLLGPDGRPLAAVTRSTGLGPRHTGITSGRLHAGNEQIFHDVVDASLACLVDETQPADVREDCYAHLVGFLEGWVEALTAATEAPKPKPLRFLTVEETERVMSLPRGPRRAWLAEYRQACRRYARKGGTASGRSPVLPAIP